MLQRLTKHFVVCDLWGHITERTWGVRELHLMLMAVLVSSITARGSVLLSPPWQLWGRCCSYLIPDARCGIWIPELNAKQWLQLQESHCWSLTLTAKGHKQISYVWGSPFPNTPVFWSAPSHNRVVTESRRINISALHISLTFASTPLENHTTKTQQAEAAILWQSPNSNCCYMHCIRLSFVWPKRLWLLKMLCQYATHTTSSHAILSYLKIHYSVKNRVQPNSLC